MKLFQRVAGSASASRAAAGSSSRPAASSSASSSAGSAQRPSGARSGETDDDDSSGSLREPGSGKEHDKDGKRRSLLKMERKNTQDILSEPDQFVERLLASGVFGPDLAQFVGVSGRQRGEVYKDGLIEKQGNFFKTWHTRYFVLSDRGLSYYNDKKKYRAGYMPLGFISFKDMEDEGGQVVHDVPEHLTHVLQLAGKRNLFCIHLASRTYVMSAASREDKEDWARALTKAYNHRKRTGATITRPAKPAPKAKEPLKPAGIFDALRSREEIDALFEEELMRMRKRYQTMRTFEAWRLFTRHCAREGKVFKAAGRPPRAPQPQQPPQLQQPPQPGGAAHGAGHHRRKSSALSSFRGLIGS
jgi:hypothetical protein